MLYDTSAFGLTLNRTAYKTRCSKGFIPPFTPFQCVSHVLGGYSWKHAQVLRGRDFIRSGLWLPLLCQHYWATVIQTDKTAAPCRTYDYRCPSYYLCPVRCDLLPFHYISRNVFCTAFAARTNVNTTILRRVGATLNNLVEFMPTFRPFTRLWSAVNAPPPNNLDTLPPFCPPWELDTFYNLFHLLFSGNEYLGIKNTVRIFTDGLESDQRASCAGFATRFAHTRPGPPSAVPRPKVSGSNH